MTVNTPVETPAVPNTTPDAAREARYERAIADLDAIVKETRDGLAAAGQRWSALLGADGPVDVAAVVALHEEMDAGSAKLRRLNSLRDVFIRTKLGIKF